MGAIQDNLNYLNMVIDSIPTSHIPTYPNIPRISYSSEHFTLPQGNYPPTSRPYSTHNPKPSSSKSPVHKPHKRHNVSSDEDWGSPFSPLCTGSILDPSGLSDRYSIGHLIKGLFDWDFPRFEVIESPTSPSSSHKSYQLPIEVPFHILQNKWLKGVRGDLGLLLEDMGNDSTSPTCIQPGSNSSLPSQGITSPTSVTTDLNPRSSPPPSESPGESPALVSDLSKANTVEAHVSSEVSENLPSMQPISISPVLSENILPSHSVPHQGTLFLPTVSPT